MVKDSSSLIKLQSLPKSQKEIDSIKKDFLLQDVKHKEVLQAGYVPEIAIKGSKIIAEVITDVSKDIYKDEFGLDYEVEVFHAELEEKDFSVELEKSFEFLFEDYCKRFIAEIDLKGIFTKDLLAGFIKSKLARIDQLKSFYIDESDIEPDIKKMILNFLDKLYEYISNFNLDNIQISDKIKFKLSKNEVILLFQIMLNKGVISGMVPNDLYRILERHVLYKDKNGNYSQMKKVRIQANKLIQGNVSADPGLNKLAKLFNHRFFKL